MVATPIEDLVQTVAAAFEAERLERDEVIGYRSQSPESAARVDAAVRAAVLKAVQHPDAWQKYTHFGAEHYVRGLEFGALPCRLWRGADRRRSAGTDTAYRPRQQHGYPTAA